jgi:hypothetical protein
MSSAEHIRLQYSLENNPALLTELVERPDETLKSLGMDMTALTCPDSAHEALERGDSLAQAGNDQFHDAPLAEALPRFNQLAKQRFGPGLTVSKIPFGVQFSEPVANAGDVTGTGTVKCQFGGLSCGGDVDG